MTASTPHLLGVGYPDLTPDEMYAFILMADMGGQFASREDAPAN
jgi:hypothetical protein